MFPVRSLLASFLAPVRNQEGEHEAAVQALVALGGSLRVIAANTDEMEAAFHLSGNAIDDAGLVHLPAVQNLRWLNLRGTKITDAGLVSVGQCGLLTRLHLEKTAIGDAGLEHLKPLQQLEYLNLYGTAVTDAGLVHLAELKALKKVYLWQTQVTPEGAAKLREALPECEVVLGTEAAAPAPPAEPMPPAEGGGGM